MAKSIDWIMELYDRKSKRVSAADLSRMLDISILGDLTETLVEHADSQYRHDSLDASRII